MSTKLLIASKATPFPYGAIAVAAQVNAVKANAVTVEFRDAKTLEADGAAKAVALIKYEGNNYDNVNAIARLLGRLHPEAAIYNPKDPISSTLIDQWLDFAESKLATADFKSLDGAFKTLNKYLTLRSYLVGYHASIADFVVWGTLRASPVFARIIKTKKESLGNYLVRWYDYISSLEAAQYALNSLQKLTKAAQAKTSDQGKFEIGLTEAEMGKVCTRFPPEPSGYLHIGHAKAALMNQYFAQTYKGKLIIRFDDTNPSKEKTEFEDSIKEDLALIGVDSSVVTHTSDYFDQMYDYALKMIKEGKAYVDDTDQATMRDERMKGLPSKCRDLSVEENLRRFEEMKNGTEFGQTCCLRAKIKHDDLNGTLRDPVIYRCNLTPHHYTGDKWKIYPTYDFACPIVDSIEGVSHALRTNEYRDRNVQYYWMLEALGLRKPVIWDFSRMNFVYTLLSKRKLQWFVNEGHVTGWDDPRFPTVRGIRRRGLTIEALKQYILMQGASQNTLLLEWDKLWAINRKVIDPIAPRHTAVLKDNMVHVNIQGAPATPEVKEVPKHKKNLDIGQKKTTYSNHIVFDQEDAVSLEVGEEITLMDWGNAFVRKVEKDEAGKATSVDLELHLEGDFKKTKKKISWLSYGDEVADVVLLDYDYLITKKKVEEGDDVKDLVTPVSEFKVSAVADANVKDLKKGDIIQFERKGYYILDAPATDAAPAHFIHIPDGKATSTASKADDKKPAAKK
ncbi:tRNA synthetases class I, catalytic domain-containing protein [Radiomyces spectabilis]|uniref:tRNA synthetases class I, catalytic domain-containing protein n=1 Tax=Radiomyces spectabilis TaxID=64574 RepID=UPI00221EB400|nr:tRNA synthetases class I, catalytic domain-containing protein [Radiomyces spectabilis]KAI8393800.1 tRNA synthetases class I, catalytic domain-containing protein [Radiomyces spectabilis]